MEQCSIVNFNKLLFIYEKLKKEYSSRYLTIMSTRGYGQEYIKRIQEAILMQLCVMSRL